MAKQPIFIGGIGGSGTRSVVTVLDALGLQTAKFVNESLDFRWFAFLFKQTRFFHLHEKLPLEQNLKLFKKIMLGKSLSQQDKKLIESPQQKPEHPISLDYLTASIPNEIEVVKEPNMLYFTEELNALFPQSKFILVIRNPLEMAISSNQQQLINWGANFGCTDVESINERLRFWMEVHRYAAQKLALAYPNRYLILDYNSLGSTPEKEIKCLAAFAECIFTETQISEICNLIIYKAKNVESVEKQAEKRLLDEVMRYYEELKSNYR